MATQQELTDAWSFQADWCSNLGSEIVRANPVFSVPNQNVSDIGACAALNVIGAHSYNSCTGTPVLSLSNIKISAFDGTAIVNPPSFPNIPVIPVKIAVLPIKFTTLTITGSYAYTISCQLYSTDTGKAVGPPTSLTESGTFSETYTNSTLDYLCRYVDAIGIIQATIAGTPDITVTPSEHPSAFEEFFSLFKTNQVISGVSTCLSTSLLTTSITNELVSRLNQHIGGSPSSLVRGTPMVATPAAKPAVFQSVPEADDVQNPAGVEGDYSLDILAPLMVTDFGLLHLAGGVITGQDKRGASYTGKYSLSADQDLQLTLSPQFTSPDPGMQNAPVTLEASVSLSALPPYRISFEFEGMGKVTCSLRKSLKS